MGITFIAPQGTYTAPAKLINKTITQNRTYNAADDNANGYSSVTVNVEGGGGGSSDFSTAEVTIIGAGYFEGAFVAYDRGCTVGTRSLEDETVEIILAENGAEIFTEDNVSSTSGSIEYGGESGLYVITGDCTITIS